MEDKLMICPLCGSDAMFVQQVSEEVSNSMCYGCGMLSNTLMKEGEEFFIQQKEHLPELYKDLIKKDTTGQKWIPTVVNLPDKGMVFIQGTSVADWSWVGVKAVMVTEAEKEKYPIPGKKGEFYQMRMDMTTLKSFGQTGFIDALTFIGVLPE